jgi:hypothetical protein
MKYALIKDTTKLITIKEIDLDKTNSTVTITSLKDEVYVEQYLNSDEVLERLIGLNRGFNYANITAWWESL